MIRYFCDCCGNEITDTNRIEGDKGRLLGALRPKIKTQSEPLQVEVTTALGSCWNSGHFCRYCVIDAVNSKDDRPMPDTVPRHELRQSETRHANLLLDLGRLIDGEEPINGFTEVERLREMLRGNAGVMVEDEPFWHAVVSKEAPVRTWQHDETGRITQTAECPGPRWVEVPAGVRVPRQPKENDRA